MVRPMAWVLLLTCGLWACVSVPGEAAPGRHELIVLGIAQDGGVPHVGCERDCCAQAQRRGQRFHPVSLGLHDRQTGRLLLIEATPAIDAQIRVLHAATATHGRGRKPVDGVLLTHAHIGHYLGLAQLGREVAGSREVELFVSPRFAGFLTDHGPWSQLVALGQVRLRPFVVGEAFSPMQGITVEPIAVPHRDEFSDTMAFKIRGPNKTVLFVPDVDRWDRVEGLIGRLLDDVDIAYVDGTFFDGRELPERDITEIPHPPVVDTMRRLGDRAWRDPGAVRFIHLNHTNPLLHDAALRAEIERQGFGVARRGERVAL